MKKPFKEFRNETGSALIMTMILLAVLSVMAASMISLSNTEGWSTANYRMMSQARDGAEAAVYRAAHFLAGNAQPGPFTYLTPAAVSAFDGSGNTSPVTYSGNPVKLVASSNITSPPTENYPSSGAGIQANVASNFASNATGTLAAGTTPIRYGAYAELLSIKTVSGFAGDFALERWRITGEGRIGAANSEGATVVVSTIMDRPPQAAPPTTVYATSTTCDSSNPPLNLNGGSITASYDSTTSGCSVATFSTNCGVASSGGNIGTNGYANLGNSATVNGSVYEVQNGGIGGGNCSPATTGSGTVSGTPPIIYQSQAPNFPNPLPPTPTPTAGNMTIQNNGSCDSTTGCSRGGVIPSGEYKIAPTCTPAVPQCGSGTVYQDLNLKGSTFHLCAGTYNANSIAITSNATIIVHSTAASDPLNICGGVYGPTMINVLGAGLNSGQTAIDFTGGTLSNPSLSAANFKLLYAGTAVVNVTGGAGSAALVYAPSAAVSLTGSATFYGAIVGNTFTSSGGADISYDRSLANALFQPGNPMLQAFTWKNF